MDYTNQIGCPDRPAAKMNVLDFLHKLIQNHKQGKQVRQVQPVSETSNIEVGDGGKPGKRNQVASKVRQGKDEQEYIPPAQFQAQANIIQAENEQDN